LCLTWHSRMKVKAQTRADSGTRLGETEAEFLTG